MTPTVEIPTDITEYRKFVADGGLNPEAEKAEKTEAEPEPEKAPEHRQKSGFQRRVDKLNQRLGAKDAEIAELRKQVEARGATPAKTEPEKAAEPAKQEAAAPAKPKVDDFPTYDEYIEALTDWKTEAAITKREASRQVEQAQRTAENQTKTVLDTYATRVDEAKTRYPEWDKAFEGLKDDSFGEAMMVSIFESDTGPDVTYYLATNRDELKRIAALSPVRQAVEIGKIEAKLAKEEPDDKPEPEEKPKPRVTQAPAPAKPIKGKATSDDAMPDPKDFEKYQAWSLRQAAARRGR